MCYLMDLLKMYLLTLVLMVNVFVVHGFLEKPGTIPGFDVRKHRDYYIQVEKIVWDYLPAGENLVNSRDEYLNDSLIPGLNRIGSTAFKYVYKQYTDDSYTTEVRSPVHMGLLGPLIRGEVGEILRIHFRNTVDHPVTIHPHGARYDKFNEGAYYEDATFNVSKFEDGVPKGQAVTLTWKLDANFAPRDDDDNCIPFSYHSHKYPDQEVNAGLLGLLIICKQGTLTAGGIRGDVDHEFVLYLDSIDEADSLLTEENLQRCGDPAECKRLLDSGDETFVLSLERDSVNGYMYGNMPGFEVCKGEKVALYVFSLNKYIHPFNIQGQTFLYERHRTAVLGLFPATFKVVEMVPENPGRWLIACLNTEHYKGGMTQFLYVNDCGSNDVKQPLTGNIRTYYIKAESEVWNYAPSGMNMYNGGSLTGPGSASEKYFGTTSSRIGETYKKSRFVEYVDQQFQTQKVRPDSEKHLGILGPIIRAEVGDTISIYLQNQTPRPVSIYLQGTSMNHTENGIEMKYSNSTYPTKVVMPGEMKIYTFTVPWSVSPGDSDPQCLTYLYYSNYNLQRDVNSGLIGPLMICRPGVLDPATNLQKYISKDLFLYYSSIDENLSWYIDENMATFVPGRTDKSDADFVESNIIRSINGRSYGNLEGLDVCQNDDVMWHVLSFGQNGILHGVTFNGNNVLIDGINRDSHMSVSGLAFTAMMHPDNIGNWSISCHNNYHFNAGMKATYSVSQCGNTQQPFVQTSGVTRRYYIAAVERKWNYAPVTIHPLTGEDFNNRSSAQFNRVQKDGKFIGSVYTKALYREYKDETFTQEKPVTNDTLHLGVLGPFIRAEVGDVVEVVFKNMASRPYSIHPQGLRYNKTNEGMRYGDGSSSFCGDSVQPGSTFVYRWEVPATSGPAQNEANCKNLMYYSAVDPVKDTYSGLAGPIVICRRNILDSQGRRRDSVEKEFAILFQAFNENESWYLNKNIQENCPTADTSTPEFAESNMYDSVNGLVYDNVRGLAAKVGENIAWYVMGLGESEDVHTAHFHGQTYIYRSATTHEGDVVEVFPGTYETVEMFASNPGTWLLHCHVGEHTTDGMIATYTIY